MDFEGIVIIIVLLGGGGLAYWGFNYYRKKQVIQVAEELGLEFLPSVELRADLDGCDLLSNRGSSQKFINCFGGEAEDIHFKVFEYQYWTGFGKNRRLNSQTVTYINLENWELPDFHVRPKSFFGKVLGGAPVNTIEIDPEFSTSFYVSCLDPPKVRPLFDESIKNLVRLQNWSVESHRGRLLIYKYGKTVSHTQLKPFLTSSLELMMQLDETRKNGAPLPALPLPMPAPVLQTPV